MIRYPDMFKMLNVVSARGKVWSAAFHPEESDDGSARRSWEQMHWCDNQERKREADVKNHV